MLTGTNAQDNKESVLIKGDFEDVILLEEKTGFFVVEFPSTSSEDVPRSCD